MKRKFYKAVTKRGEASFDTAQEAIEWGLANVIVGDQQFSEEFELHEYTVTKVLVTFPPET